MEMDAANGSVKMATLGNKVERPLIEGGPQLPAQKAVVLFQL